MTGNTFYEECTGPEYAFAVGGIRGMRIWRTVLHEDGRWMLHSAYSGYKWLPGHNTAICMHNNWVLRYQGSIPVHHHVVDERCQCGFYGYHDINSLNRLAAMSGQFGPDAPPRAQARIALGVINGWGRTLVGELGFRSEFAQVTAMFMHSRDDSWGSKPDIVRSIGESYPVPLFDNFNDMIEAFPLGEADI